MLRIRSLFAGLVCALVATATAATAATASAPYIQFRASMGDFTVEVYPDKAPRTVANFLQYVRDGFYKGTIFHRVMDGFMIQDGGFTPDMKQKDTRPPVEIESKNDLKNDKYTIAMARTMDPNSATAQFYMNVVDNNMLNYLGQDGYGYIVFSKVAEGTGTIDKIKTVETTTKFPYQNVPVKPIVIESATVVSKQRIFAPSKGFTMTQVKLHTSHDDIALALDAEKVPKSAANFVAYVKDGHYNGTVFRRVIKGFMIQGGGSEPGEKVNQEPAKAPIDNEANNGLKDERGVIAMARTNDPHPVTAQLFIDTVDNDLLNHTSPTPQGWGYAVFGKVTEGADVVDKIRSVRTGDRGFHQDVPLEDVIIESAKVIE